MYIYVYIIYVCIYVNEFIKKKLENSISGKKKNSVLGLKTAKKIPELDTIIFFPVLDMNFRKKKKSGN